MTIVFLLVQEEIKESDRSLMEIFKQLEGDVSDLSTCVHSWRFSQYSQRDSTISEGRPVSASDLDLSILDDSPSASNQSLASAKEDSLKSHLSPEVDSANGSSTYSPVLSSQGLATTAYNTGNYRMSSSATTSNIAAGSKMKSNASPQLKSSASMNKISLASPSLISRLQDETTSINSRNSSESIDSGVQFENGSGNVVESTTQATSIVNKTIPEATDGGMEFGDFASDVLSMLGMKT